MFIPTIVYQPGARGDFLASILTNNVGHNFAHSQLSCKNYFKIHLVSDPSGTGGLMEIMAWSPSLANEIKKDMTHNKDFERILINAKKYSDAIFRISHLGNFKNLRIIAGLEEAKVGIPAGYDSYTHLSNKHDLDHIDQELWHYYDEIIDFQDLFDLEKINQLRVKYTNTPLTDYEREMITYNINLQGATFK